MWHARAKKSCEVIILWVRLWFDDRSGTRGSASDAAYVNQGWNSKRHLCIVQCEIPFQSLCTLDLFLVTVTCREVFTCNVCNVLWEPLGFIIYCGKYPNNSTTVMVWQRRLCLYYHLSPTPWTLLESLRKENQVANTMHIFPTSKHVKHVQFLCQNDTCILLNVVGHSQALVFLDMVFIYWPTLWGVSEMCADTWGNDVDDHDVVNFVLFVSANSVSHPTILQTWRKNSLEGKKGRKERQNCKFCASRRWKFQHQCFNRVL